MYVCMYVCMYVDVCDEELEQVVVDGIERGVLQWTAMAIGSNAVVLSCPCAQASLPRQASRVCAGDLVSGAHWSQSDTSQCQFDALTWDLCSAEVSTCKFSSHSHDVFWCLECGKCCCTHIRPRAHLSCGCGCCHSYNREQCGSCHEQ